MSIVFFPSKFKLINFKLILKFQNCQIIEQISVKKNRRLASTATKNNRLHLIYGIDHYNITAAATLTVHSFNDSKTPVADCVSLLFSRSIVCIFFHLINDQIPVHKHLQFSTNQNWFYWVTQFTLTIFIQIRKICNLSSIFLCT